MNASLLVLAAGMGSRYGGLKQLDGFGPNAETLLEYSVYDALRAGFDEVVFAIRRDFEAAFREQVLSRFEGQIRCRYVYQELDDLPPDCGVDPSQRQKPWGTGHAVRAAREVLEQPFAVINADDFYGRDAFFEAARFLGQVPADSRHYALVCYELGKTLSENGTVSRGVCRVADNGQLLGVEEHTELRRADTAEATGLDGSGQSVRLPLDQPVSLNLFLLTPTLFPLLEGRFGDFLRQPNLEKAEFYLPSALNSVMQSGEATVEALRTEASWIGVTHPQDRPLALARIEQVTAAGAYPTPLWSA